MKYVDLYASVQSVDAARRMGWSGFCVPIEYKSPSEFQKYAQQVKALGADVLAAALITSDVSKCAKSAINAADLVIVDSRSEQACRDAAESYDVDLIVNPEVNEEKDLIDSRASGLDDVIAEFMAERDIGYVLNIGNVLYSGGVRRVQLLGRIQQNVRLAKKHKVKVLLSCGARRGADVRNPHDTMNFAANLGLNVAQSRAAVSSNPLHFIKRAEDRANQNVLTTGLTVESWGKQEALPKRRSGWY